MVSDTPAKVQEVVSVQILRGIAALLVLLGHASKEIFHEVGFYPVIDFTLIGQSGVDIFFVISGFIMVYTSHLRARRPGFAQDFLVRRTIRIAPLYWIFSLATLAVSVAGSLNGSSFKNHDDLRPEYVLSSFFFLPMPRMTDAHFTPLLGVGWTLNFEMFFYVIMALSVFLARGRYAYLLLALILLIALVGAIIPIEQEQIYFWTRSIIVEFAFGGLIALLFTYGVRLARFWSLALFAAAITWAIVVCSVLNPLDYSVRLFAWGIPAALLVAGAVLGHGWRWNGPQWVSGIARRLGDTSYSLYLSHMFAIRLVSIALPASVIGLGGGLVFLVVASFVSAIAADLVFRFLEQPITKFLNMAWNNATSYRYKSARPM